MLGPGDDYAALPEAVGSRTGGRGADVFFELVGTTEHDDRRDPHARPARPVRQHRLHRPAAEHPPDRLHPVRDQPGVHGRGDQDRPERRDRPGGRGHAGRPAGGPATRWTASPTPCPPCAAAACSAARSSYRTERSSHGRQDPDQERHRRHDERRGRRALRRLGRAGRRPDRRRRPGRRGGRAAAERRPVAGDRRRREGGAARAGRPALPHRARQGMERPPPAVGVPGDLLVPDHPGAGRRRRLLGRAGQLHRVDPVRRHHGQRHVPPPRRPGRGGRGGRDPGGAVQRRRRRRARPGHPGRSTSRRTGPTTARRTAGSRSTSASSGCRSPRRGCCATPGPWPTISAPGSTST